LIAIADEAEASTKALKILQTKPFGRIHDQFVFARFAPDSDEARKYKAKKLPTVYAFYVTKDGGLEELGFENSFDDGSWRTFFTYALDMWDEVREELGEPKPSRKEAKPTKEEKKRPGKEGKPKERGKAGGEEY
jgi:hypothetical protein